MTSHTNQGIPWLQSLGTRAIVITLAVFVVNLWALSFYASRLLQADMQRVLGEQQFQAVSFVAAEINDELVLDRKPHSSNEAGAFPRTKIFRKSPLRANSCA